MMILQTTIIMTMVSLMMKNYKYFVGVVGIVVEPVLLLRRRLYLEIINSQKLKKITFWFVRKASVSKNVLHTADSNKINLGKNRRSSSGVSTSSHILKMENSLFCSTLRYESSTLILIRSWVVLSFKVCQSVRKALVTPDQISTFSIYKVINALHWPNNINYCLILTQYHQVPTIAVLNWPSTQLHQIVTHSWANLI